MRKRQSYFEEWLNFMSHGLTGLAAVAGMVVLIVMGGRSDKDMALFSALFYGISLVVLYAFSALYHALRHEKAKQVFNILDHCGIFLLIAGSYTPVLLISIRGTTGWVFFGILWGLALTGIVMKVFTTGKFRALSAILYAVMGWLFVFKIGLIREILPPPGFWLLMSGGFTYSAGIVFYLLDKRFRLSHFIWHIFVIAGSTLHFLMMAMYVFR